MIQNKTGNFNQTQHKRQIISKNESGVTLKNVTPLVFDIFFPKPAIFLETLALLIVTSSEGLRIPNAQGTGA
jgi:hypothetical protein